MKCILKNLSRILYRNKLDETKDPFHSNPNKY